MKKVLAIVALFVFVSTLNLSAMDDAGGSYMIDNIDIRGFNAELLKLFPNDCARLSLISYFVEAKNLKKSLEENSIDESTYNQKIGAATTEVVKNLLSYGVDTEALNQLSQDPRWSSFFGDVLKSFKRADWRTCKSRICYCCMMIPAVYFIVLYIMIVHSLKAPYAIRCLGHAIVSDCPCSSERDRAFECAFHVLQGFIFGHPCPCAQFNRHMNRHK